MLAAYMPITFRRTLTSFCLNIICPLGSKFALTIEDSTRCDMIMARGTILLAALTFLCSCEPFYDPVRCDDVPTSPGSEWDKKSFTVKKRVEIPFEVTDLSGTMPLSRLLDIALYNNPSTRASWHAARASAYAYRASLSTFYPSILYEGSLNAQLNRGSSFANSSSGIVSGVGAVNGSFPSTNLSNDLTPPTFC